MLINLRNALMAGKRKPTARDYNYDLALWDAIENAGYGVHDASATTITNLLGGGLDIALSGNYTVNANNIRFNGGYGIADKYNFSGRNGATISVLASYDSATALNAQGWSYAGDTIPRLSAYRENNGWFLSATSPSLPSKITIPLTAGQLIKLDFVWDVENQVTAVFRDGVFAGSDSSYVFSLGSMQNHFRMMAYGNTSDGVFRTYNGNIYNCAVSTRALTAAEITANYAIDKARFGLS